MKKSQLFVLIAGMAAGAAAQADGFICKARNTGATIRVFNQTQPLLGTRSVAVMVISNPAIQRPNKTIAKFSSENQTLHYVGKGLWMAKVDLRYKDSNRKGELIGGTKLGQLNRIDLELDFSYNSVDTQFARVSQTNGVIRYFKRAGDYNVETVTCQRYLKTGI